MAHICEWPGCTAEVKADWRPLCYRHWLESQRVADDEAPEQESQPTPSRAEPGHPAPSQSPQIDFGAEIRKALDQMVRSGEIEFGNETEAPSGPSRQPPPPAGEDDETRFERWLEARENRARRDQEEKSFRERVTKKLEQKPRWFEPWRP